MIRTKLKKILSYRFTFMLVPHGSAHPRQINIHLGAILAVMFLWTGVTLWGSYLSARHVDYWRAQMSNQVLKMKIQYLLDQLDKSRAYMDEVKTVDSQLRQLLHYQSEAATATEKPVAASDMTSEAAGGPTSSDENDLSRILDSQDPNISWQHITDKVLKMRFEAHSRITSFDELTGWIDTQRRLFRATPRGWPCEGHMTSFYGTRPSPFDGSNDFHPGIDISAPQGTPVRATADGIVRLSSWNSGYGNLVIIQHEFGFTTRYAHNSRLLVRVGDRVKRGQVVSLIGTTGTSTGPHCHYEVWRHNVRQNPISYLREDPSPTKSILTRQIPNEGSVKKRS